MIKFILLSLLSLLPLRAQAACTRLPGGLTLDVPSYGDGANVWAQCLVRDLNILNSNSAPTIVSSNAIITNELIVTTVAAYGAQGIFFSSPTVFGASITVQFPLTITSTVTITGKDSNGYSLFLSSGLNMPNGTVNANFFQGNGSGLTNLSATDTTKVLKTGDTMTGTLTVLGASVTATGSVNSDTYFKSGASIGVTQTCPSGQTISNTQVVGGIIVGGFCSTTGSGGGGANFLRESFTADGVRTNFVLSSTPTSSASIFLILDGRQLYEPTDYVFTSPSTINTTFSPSAQSSSLFVSYSSGVAPASAGDAFLNGNNIWTGRNTFTNSVTLAGSTLSVTGQDASGYSIKTASGILIGGVVSPSNGIRYADGSISTSAALSTPAGSSLTGSGTTNSLTKWTGTNSLGNSNVTDNGSTFAIGEPVTVTGNSITAGSFIGDGSALTGIQHDPQMIGFTTKQDVTIGAIGQTTSFTPGIPGAGTHMVRYYYISLPPSFYRTGGTNVIQQATEVAGEIPAFVSGTLKNLVCLSDTAPGAGGNADSTFTFTVRKNETATALTCAITGASAVSCTNTGSTPSVSAGDRISLEIDTFSNTNPGANRPPVSNGSCFFQYAF